MASHLPVEPPAFFHRGPSPTARLVFFGLISIALLFLDARYRYMEHVRQVVAIALHPVQRAAALPAAVIAGVGDYFASKRALAVENEALKRRLVEAGAKAQGAATIAQENERLKSLLGVRARVEGGGIAVEVLYTGRDAFQQKVIVDKGRDAGVSAGAAVVDADGIVGQVTRTYPYVSEVTLLTDKDHVIPVKVERNGVRAVMAGAGAGRAPELRFMSPTADVRVGDLLVTSGLDGTYPQGLAVARVASVERDTGQMFARITVTPVGGVDRSEQLLVLARSQELPPRPDDPVADPEAPKKPGRGRAARGG
jgi:rod shape-determining protein MreC